MDNILHNSFVVICYTVIEKISLLVFLRIIMLWEIITIPYLALILWWPPSGELDWEIQALEGSFHQNYRSQWHWLYPKGYVNVLTIIPSHTYISKRLKSLYLKEERRKNKIFLMHATMLIILSFVSSGTMT